MGGRRNNSEAFRPRRAVADLQLPWRGFVGVARCCERTQLWEQVRASVVVPVGRRAVWGGFRGDHVRGGRAVQFCTLGSELQHTRQLSNGCHKSCGKPNTHISAERLAEGVGSSPWGPRSAVNGRADAGPVAGGVAAPPPEPATGVAGVRLPRAGEALVEGGGSRMKRRCGFSRAGSSADAGDAPGDKPVPMPRLDGDAPGVPPLRGAGPAPKRGVVERSVSSGEGRSVVMVPREGRALMPTLGSGTLTEGNGASAP